MLNRLSSTLAVFRTLLFLLLSHSIMDSHAQQVDQEHQKVTAMYPTWQGVVKSSHFMAWFRQQSEEMKSLAGSNRSTDAIRMLDAYQQFRVQTSAEGFLRLNCTLSEDPQNRYAKGNDMIFLIDTVTSRSGSNVIEVTYSEIRFTSEGKELYQTSINRHTGYFRITSPTYPILAQGKCTPISGRLF